MMVLHRKTGTKEFKTGLCAGRGRLAARLCPRMKKQKEEFRTEKDRAACTGAGWSTLVRVMTIFIPALSGRIISPIRG
ncbi:MAG: hypothetical protein ACI4WY_03235 [Anaerovoracaceae bacterium]